MSAPDDPLRDPARLAAVHAADLVGAAPEEAFDQLTRLAARLVNAPIAFVSVLTDERQHFVSATGLEGPHAEAGSAPVAVSVCRHVVASGDALVVRDAREDPRLRDDPAVGEHGVVAYLGVPLVNAQAHALGTLCVLDSKPRTWSAQEVETLRALAATVISTVAMRAAARAAGRASPATGRGAPDDGAGRDERALRAAASAYLGALEHYEDVVRGAAGSAAELDEEAVARRAVAEGFVALERALERHVHTAAAGAEAEAAGEHALGARQLAGAVRDYVRAEKSREQASVAFLERRIGLDDFQVACAAVRAPELALRRTLIDTEPGA